MGKTPGQSKRRSHGGGDEEVQQSIQEKKAAKKALDKQSTDAIKLAYKEKKKHTKKAVAAAKAHDQLYEEQRRVLRIAKQRDKNSKDIYHTKLIRDDDGIVLMEDDKI